MSELTRLLDSIVGEDEWSRHQALERLKEEGVPPEQVEPLLEFLSGDDAARRTGARMVLAALASPDSPSHDPAQAALRTALRVPDPDLRLLAASALGEAGSLDAGPALIAALNDEDPNVSAAAADALGELGYAPALDPLVRLAEDASFWVRAAVIVALGQLRDERAVPVLAEIARTPGLERPLVEALRSIGHPDGLSALETIARTAPEDAAVAAGAILCANPEVDAPEWVVRHAAREVDALRVRFLDADEPAVGRLLGLSAAPDAIETLLSLVGPPRRSEAALTGLLAVPPDQRSEAVLEHLEQAGADELPALLALLPPQREPERIARLVPYLSHGSTTVRSAAAEALARAPAQRALPLLHAELEEHGLQPEVVRALGGLGDQACGALLPLLSDGSPSVRGAAADALARCAGRSVSEELAGALEAEADPEVRRSLIRAIGYVAGDEHMDLLQRALRDDDPETRLVAIEALGATGDVRAADPLVGALDAPLHQRLVVLRALGELGVPETLPAIAARLDATDPEERRAAARALVPVAPALEKRLVRRLAEDEDEWLRLSAARALARRGGEGGAMLERMAEEDPAPTVRAEARRLLRRSG